jgi:phage terminase large subunit-like protein
MKLVNDLKGDGLNVVAFGQGYASTSAPSKELEKLVLGKELRHKGHPVLRWCASNVMVETDAAGNIKPSKRKSTDRIDGIVALVMAIGVAATAEAPSAPGILEL